MSAGASTSRQMIEWVRSRRSGPAALREAKHLRTRGRDLWRQASAAVDERGPEPPVEWTSEAKWSAVTPEVPVDPSLVTHLRAEYFPRAGPAPWLDRPDARSLVHEMNADGQISDYEARLARKWIRDGYVCLPRFFDSERLDYVWKAYQDSVDTGVVQTAPEPPHFDGDPLPGRALNPHFSVPEIGELATDPDLMRAIDLFLGADCYHFQSITGHKASQQRIHSDSIHMTTYPEHYLIAVWIAFEDIQPGSGEFIYYPGSHTLPTVYSRQVGIEPGAWSEHGYEPYNRLYEPRIEWLISELGLEPQLFQAKKGDALFWHANLLHGGSKRTNFAASRRAFVFHYFAKGALCYHDLGGTRADDREPR